MQLRVEQRRFGPRSFLACVLVINILMIMPVDLYAPALPSLTRELGVSEAVLNSTMFAFFFCTAFSVLLGTPLSDRFGRRVPLAAACALMCLSSLLCAAAPTLAVLVAGRVGQAFAYGVETAIVTAIIRDAYEGESLKLAMTLSQSLLIIGPAVAPFLGTFLLAVTSWRGIFACLALFGAVCTVLSLLLDETLDARYRACGGVVSSLVHTFSFAGGLLRSRVFIAMLGVMSLASVPYFAWVATVSYDLLDFFNLGYVGYSVCYGGTCLVTVLSPYAYLFLSKRLEAQRILGLCFCLVGVTLVCLVAFGMRSPLAFALSFLPFAFAEGIVRPLAMVVLLQQPPERVAAASMTTNFVYNVASSLATVVATLPWVNFIVGLDAIMAASLAGMLALFAWGVRGAELSLEEE